MKKIKKALRGYSPAAVRQLIAELQENHRVLMDELKEQVLCLAEEHARLTEERNRLTLAEKRQHPVLSDQVAAKRLMEAHLVQTEAVWEALQELKSQEDRLQAESADKQSEKDRMLEQMERRLRETLAQIAEGRGIT